jgi:hypothetical protein
MVGGQVTFDHELFDALYSRMRTEVVSLCLIDTCHSGTMLDLEYISTDGIKFVRSAKPQVIRPFSVSISACSDFELAGEDISVYAGWGGKLMCQFMDYLNVKESGIHILSFYSQVRKVFMHQAMQASHPIISYNN